MFYLDSGENVKYKQNSPSVSVSIISFFMQLAPPSQTRTHHLLEILQVMATCQSHHTHRSSKLRWARVLAFSTNGRDPAHASKQSAYPTIATCIPVEALSGPPIDVPFAVCFDEVGKPRNQQDDLRVI